MPQVPEFSTEQMLEKEKETTGLYISGHPLLRLQKTAKLLKCTRVSDILAADDSENGALHDGSAVKVMVIISKVTLKHLKNGADMAFLSVEDAFGEIEMLVFPQLLEQYRPFLGEGKIILVEGKISLREDEAPKVLLNRLQPFDEAAYSNMKCKLYLRLPSKESAQCKEAERILAAGEGQCAVYFYYTDSGKYENLNTPQGYIHFDSPEAEALENLVGSENAAYRN